jgi:hypothetical protein
VKNGEASYNGELLFGLEPETFEKLEREVRALGETRMRVLRVADLAASSITENRGRGRSYLVFKYGNWQYVRRAGFASNATDVPEDFNDVLDLRLSPNPVARAEADIISSGVAGARRTLEWLESTYQWKAGQDVFAVEPWADRVKQLATEVIEPSRRHERAAASHALIEWIFGSSAAAIEQNGLSVFLPGGKGLITPLIEALHQTSRAPLEQGADLSEWGPLFSRTTIGWDVAPAQGTNPHLE